ncbi:MAG: TIGR02710 family CRISPR-associated protein [Nitrospirae bacterium]|nr:MAG: TIGR02710 family CRISPR-associated protein [Nitrospirota bacterium]
MEGGTMAEPVTTPRVPKVLILSVGGSLEPITTSIQHHHAQHVVFFASEQSVEQIGTIKAILHAQQVTFTNENVIVRDAQDLTDCYAQALVCTDRALGKGCQPSEVLVDFTGGTKPMSAALALATVGRGFTFSYVGGSERTKTGLGTVVTGTEQLLEQVDPFQFFAVQERRKIALYFERYQFEAAQTVLAGLLERYTAGPLHVAFVMLHQVAQGYAAWERFQYEEALRVLKQAFRSWCKAVEANPTILYAEACPVIEHNVGWLEQLKTHTNHFRQPHTDLVADMIANAERRAEEGKYDDAVVRLYRALELAAQAAIFRRLGCETSAVPATQIPEALQKDFVQRGYESQPGTFQLPLEASYRVLAALGEPEGVHFLERQKDMKKIQSARNFSMLAHGLNPTTREAYDSLHALIATFLPVRSDLCFLRVAGPD